MARVNELQHPVTHEGGRAAHITPLQELRRTVMTCMLWEPTFYEAGVDIAARIETLVAQLEPVAVAEIAIEARKDMLLRHVPLFLALCIARRVDLYRKMKAPGDLVGDWKLVEQVLATVVDRPDELGEFVAMWLKLGGKRTLTRGIKAGLARAFPKFNEYQLAKWDSEKRAVKLLDVMRLVHPKPVTEEQTVLWKKLRNGELATPETWEVLYSAAGNDPEAKKAVWLKLLDGKLLGGLAVLRNLRNMQEVGVPVELISARLDRGIGKALPFRFLAAARYAPMLEPALENAMLQGVKLMEKLPGTTGLLVDRSGSMSGQVSAKSEVTRLDAAAGLAIMLAALTDKFYCATFDNVCEIVPPRHGFALRDAIGRPRGGTFLAGALDALRANREWANLDRMIVITDEQTHDGISPAWTKHAYVVNVGPYKHGVSYSHGWTHVDGWSERIVDYIRMSEQEDG